MTRRSPLGGAPGLVAACTRAVVALAKQPVVNQELLLRTGQCRLCTGAQPTISELQKRRKRLLWRARMRGWLELDVLIGTFTERHIHDFEDAKLDLLEEVLELENPDLFKWLTFQVPVPEELARNEIMTALLEFVKSDHGAGLHDK